MYVGDGLRKILKNKITKPQPWIVRWSVVAADDDDADNNEKMVRFTLNYWVLYVCVRGCVRFISLEISQQEV